MGNNTISQKIDAYAQANLKALKQEEAKTGKHLTKYDIAERMVKSKKLTSGELNSWLKTTEGNKECSLSAAQKNALKNTSAWIVAGFGGVDNNENAHYTARLENASRKAPKNPVEKQNAISGFHMKLNETVAERKKRYAELEKQIQEQKAINPKKALEEQKLKAHIDSVKISEADANKTASQLTREIEQQEIEMMSHEDRKKFIMDKFQDAATKKDFSGMKNALAEFNSYMCKYIDDKVGVTDVKDAIKEYSGLNALVDYVDKKVDDGDDTNLSNLELAWNITKGMGDAIDGFIGAEGLEMIGALGTASKVATIANAGKYFAVATQGYFGVEGSQLIGAGLAHAQTAETEEEARLAGSEIGMGTIMLGGAVKSAKQGFKNNLSQNNTQTLTDVLSSFKNKDGSCMFAEELKMLANHKGSTGELNQLKTAIDKKCTNGNMSVTNYARIRESLNIILQENNPSIRRMKEFGDALAKDYSNMIEPEVQNMVSYLMGKGIKVEFDGKFYKAKNENGTFSARSKGANSVYSKIKKKVIELKTEVPKNKQQADMLIGDAGGFRFTISSVDSGTINKIILETVPKNERVEFNKYFENSYKLTPAEKAKVNKNFLKYEKTITERAIHAQSDKFVAKLCDGIESGEIHLQEINNYCGRDGIPYFSQEHLQNITLSYNKWFEKASKSADYSAIKDKNGFTMAIKDKFGNKFDRALRIEDSQTNSDAIKESGYTSSQFNIIGKNGLKIEFQYRSSKINDFAEYEHVPYDIRENKETVNAPKYDKIRNILKNKDKMSDDNYKKYYNPYLTQVYNYNRRIELGMPVGEKPTLNKDNFKNLTQEEIDLISVEGLKTLHDAK